MTHPQPTTMKALYFEPSKENVLAIGIEKRPSAASCWREAAQISMSKKAHGKLVLIPDDSFGENV